MVLPLEGIKVVELSLWVLGPTCGRVLGELGADVIKVEDPEGGDPVRGLIPPRLISGSNLPPVKPYWEQWNGSKRAIAIDLNQKAGREIIYELIETVDVLITNLRPTIVDRFALDYESVAKINPKIVYAQGTGFGIKGPHRDRRAFDETAFWIRSGIMSTLGEPDAPPVPLRGAMGDLTTAVFMAGAIVTALFTRERFGFGQKVDTSLMSAGMWVAGTDIQQRLAFGEQEENFKYPRKVTTNPLRNTYQTKDGRWLFFMMMETDRFWPAICKAIGREDLEKDPRFDSHRKRIENSQLIISILDEVLATRTLEEWAKPFEQHGLIWEPETKIAEVLVDPQVSANDYVAEVEHPTGTLFKLPGIPFQFSETPIRPRKAAPELGQHTEEVLLEMGYGWTQISQLKEQKVIL